MAMSSPKTRQNMDNNFLPELIQSLPDLLNLTFGQDTFDGCPE
jgi:hypothetical protein